MSNLRTTAIELKLNERKDRVCASVPPSHREVRGTDLLTYLWNEQRIERVERGKRIERESMRVRGN